MSLSSHLSVYVQIDDVSWEPWKTQTEWEQFFTHVTLPLLSHFHLTGSYELSVVLSNDAYVKDLNQHYRAKDKPTNVLSFPQYSLGELQSMASTELPLLLGDIVISFETLTRECQEHEKLFMDHLLHLYIHSFLHLLGFDHLNDDEAKEMEDLEIHFLNSLNIKNPYQ